MAKGEKPITIKLTESQFGILQAQAAKSQVPYSTLLQRHLRTEIDTFGCLRPLDSTAETSTATSDEINRLQADLQAANARLADYQQTLLTVVNNAKAQFPITSKQLFKDATIQP